MGADGMPVSSGVLIFVGVCAIIAGSIGNNFYYSKGLFAASDKRAPSWFGRMVFIGVGTLMILVGVIHLVE
jgi:hypothetical protein